MKFVSLSEIRDHPTQFLQDLVQEGELILTTNGKPVAMITPTDESSLDESLKQIRQARARDALARVQERSLAKGLDRLTDQEIDDEMAAARRESRG